MKLKVDHLGADLIKSRLPGIRELAMTFAHVDPITTPIPVVPTCHYMMGGIPTNVHGQAIMLNADGKDHCIPGLYAVGECANVSVHGANRLGGNSLLDLVVFGRAAGMHVKQSLEEGLPLPTISQDIVDNAAARLRRWDTAPKGENPTDIRAAMHKIMQTDFGVFRTEQYMQEGLKKLLELRERLTRASLVDQSKVFNTARVEALELDNLMAVACATAVSALDRKEKL